MIDNIIGSTFLGKPKAATVAKTFRGSIESGISKASIATITTVGVTKSGALKSNIVNAIVEEYVRITENFVVRVTEDGLVRIL